MALVRISWFSKYTFTALVVLFPLFILLTVVLPNPPATRSAHSSLSSMKRGTPGLTTPTDVGGALFGGSECPSGSRLPKYVGCSFCQHDLYHSRTCELDIKLLVTIGVAPHNGFIGIQATFWFHHHLQWCLLSSHLLYSNGWLFLSLHSWISFLLSSFIRL